MKVATRKMKRWLSLFLIVVMVVTMLPQSLGGAITASAAEPGDTKSADVPDGAEEGEQGSVEGIVPEDADDTNAGEYPDSGNVEESTDANAGEDQDDANIEEGSDVTDDESLNAEDREVQDSVEKSSEEIEGMVSDQEANEDSLPALAAADSSGLGSVEEWENGERVLVIRWDEPADGNPSTEDITNAIDGYKEEAPFDVVLIESVYETSAVIVGDVFNAAADVLDPNYEARRIEYGFYSDECFYNWILVGPNGDMTEDIYVNSLMQAWSSNNGQIGFNVGRSIKNIPAESVSLYVERSEWRDADNRIRDDLFGGRERELKVLTYIYNYVVVENFYAYCGECGITIDNLAGLEEGTWYYLMHCEEDPIAISPGEVKTIELPEGSECDAGPTFSFDETILSVTDIGPNYVNVKGNDDGKTGETYLYIEYNLNDARYFQLYKVKVVYGEDDYYGTYEEERYDPYSPVWIKKLLISYQDVASGVLKEDKILRILKHRAKNGDRFNRIVIEVQPDQEQTINIEILDAASAILEGIHNYFAEYDGNLEYCFNNTEDHTYTSWTFGNLRASGDEGAFDLSNAVVMERTVAGQGMKVRLNRSFDDIPAGWIDVYMDREEWRGKQDDMLMTDIFGGRNISLKTFLFKDGDIIRAMNSGAYCGDYGVSLNVSGLSEGEDYLVLFCEGDTDNEGVDPISLVVGDEKLLPDAPEGAIWKSLNKYAVTVSDTGVVTAVGAGTTYIIARYQSGQSDCFKAYKVSVSSSDGSYIGRVEIDPESGDRMLIISIFDMWNQQLMKYQVLNALEEYRGQDKLKFDVVRLELSIHRFEDDKRGGDNQINSDVVNAAIAVLDQGNEVRRIEYSFYDIDNSDYDWEEGEDTADTLSTWILVTPHTMSSSIDASVDTSFKDNGMTFTLSVTPNTFGKAADWVGLNLFYSDGGKLLDSFGMGPKTLDIFSGTFKESNSKVTVTLNRHMTDSDGWYEGNSININNVAALDRSNSFYVTDCEELAPIEVTSKKTISDLGIIEPDPASVYWKAVNDTGTLNVPSRKGDVEVTAIAQGYAYLYPVPNTISDLSAFKIYRIWVKPKTAESIKFASENEQIELGWEYEPIYTTLKVEFDPDKSEWDITDSEKIKWATSDSSIVELVDIGGDPENPKYDGTIMAKKAGEAKITVTYIKDTTLPAEEVNKEDNILTATCTVAVVDPVKMVDEEWPEVFAITNFDAKLSDVQIPSSSWRHQDNTTEMGTWSWREPNTDLKQFQGQERADFAAVYTVEDGRTFEHALTLNLYTLTGISFLGFDEAESEGTIQEMDAPVTMVVGDTVALGYRFETDYWDWDGIVNYYKERRGEDVFDSYFDRIKTEWSSKPAVPAGSVENGGNGYASGKISYRYTGALSGAKAEKKTFTVSISDKKTGNVVLKGTHSITVTNEELFDFDTLDHWIEEGWPENGSLFFRIKKDTYKELKFKSNDTSVLKLNTKKVQVGPDEDTDDCMLVSVPYELKKYGIAYVTVTAADELQSQKIFRFEFPDRQPKLETYTVTVNKKQEDVSAEITVFTRKDSKLVDPEAVGLSGSNSDQFELTLLSDDVDTAVGEYITYRYKITARDKGTNLSKNKYSITMDFKASWNGSGENASAESGKYPVPLTVKVVNKAPSVTFKQTQKVNTFYTWESGEGYGLLTVSAGDFEIKNLTLKECDFTLESLENDPFQYKIIRTEESLSDKKGVLSCYIEGYPDPVEKNITIKTASTKPTIVLSSSSDTLYKKLEDTTSTVSLTDKATGEAVDIQEAMILGVKIRVEDEDGNIKVRKGNYNLDEVDSVAYAKNYFVVSLNQNELSFDLEGYEADEGYEDEDGEWIEDWVTKYANETATFTFKVWGDGWAKPVTFSYSINVTNDMPSLKLGASTLTLNKNSTIWTQQRTSTTLRIKGSSKILTDDFEFGTNMEDEEDENGLRVWYSPESGQVFAEFDTSLPNEDIKTGTYKYKASMPVKIGEDEDEGDIYKDIFVTLNVKVVDTAPEEGIKVTSKGSIDVLDREGTSIVYTPKLGSLTGEITGGWLEGTHQSLFASEFVDGKLIVRASAGASFATKYGYKVKARFKIQTEENGEYEVVTKELTIKVKQGKPKLSLSAGSNILYRQFNNDIEIDFKALLKQKDVAISDVSLLNYTNDLMFCPNGTGINEDGTPNGDILYYNEKTQSIRLSTQNDGKQILKFGKTWKVKFLVHYRDKAGNVKDVQATYKVIVR